MLRNMYLIVLSNAIQLVEDFVSEDVCKNGWCCLYPIVFAIFVVIVCVAMIFKKGNTFTSCLVRKLYCWLRLACPLQFT